jgi:hypothetical protein
VPKQNNGTQWKKLNLQETRTNCQMTMSARTQRNNQHNETMKANKSKKNTKVK